MTALEFIGLLAASIAAALVVHEAGHALAAKALGGEGLRVVLGWPAVRVEVKLPAGKEIEAAFLVAGVMANLGAAGAMAQTSSSSFHVAAIVQLVSVVVNVLPLGTSDGARLIGLLRRK
ncbi:MAG: hypothetical protein Q8O67_27750 [Deltaproteobacteria bacterium]|nr:hypothetical protein [Deltaproteobacteria bacterium]